MTRRATYGQGRFIPDSCLYHNEYTSDCPYCLTDEPPIRVDDGE